MQKQAKRSNKKGQMRQQAARWENGALLAAVPLSSAFTKECIDKYILLVEDVRNAAEKMSVAECIRAGLLDSLLDCIDPKLIAICRSKRGKELDAKNEMLYETLDTVLQARDAATSKADKASLSELFFKHVPALVKVAVDVTLHVEARELAVDLLIAVFKHGDRESHKHNFFHGEHKRASVLLLRDVTSLLEHATSFGLQFRLLDFLCSLGARSQSMRDEAVGRFVPTGRSLCHGPAFEDVAVLTLAAFNGERGTGVVSVSVSNLDCFGLKTSSTGWLHFGQGLAQVICTGREVRFSFAKIQSLALSPQSSENGRKGCAEGQVLLQLLLEPSCLQDVVQGATRRMLHGTVSRSDAESIRSRCLPRLPSSIAVSDKGVYKANVQIADGLVSTFGRGIDETSTANAASSHSGDKAKRTPLQAKSASEANTRWEQALTSRHNGNLANDEISEKQASADSIGLDQNDAKDLPTQEDTTDQQANGEACTELPASAPRVDGKAAQVFSGAENESWASDAEQSNASQDDVDDCFDAAVKVLSKRSAAPRKSLRESTTQETSESEDADEAAVKASADPPHAKHADCVGGACNEGRSTRGWAAQPFRQFVKHLQTTRPNTPYAEVQKAASAMWKRMSASDKARWKPQEEDKPSSKNDAEAQWKALAGIDEVEMEVEPETPAETEKPYHSVPDVANDNCDFEHGLEHGSAFSQDSGIDAATLRHAAEALAGASQDASSDESGSQQSSHLPAPLFTSRSARPDLPAAGAELCHAARTTTASERPRQPEPKQSQLTSRLGETVLESRHPQEDLNFRNALAAKQVRTAASHARVADQYGHNDGRFLFGVEQSAEGQTNDSLPLSSDALLSKLEHDFGARFPIDKDAKLKSSTTSSHTPHFNAGALYSAQLSPTHGRQLAQIEQLLVQLQKAYASARAAKSQSGVREGLRRTSEALERAQAQIADVFSSCLPQPQSQVVQKAYKALVERLAKLQTTHTTMCRLRKDRGSRIQAAAVKSMDQEAALKAKAATAFQESVEVLKRKRVSLQETARKKAKRESKYSSSSSSLNFQLSAFHESLKEGFKKEKLNRDLATIMNLLGSEDD